ncbi:hypothetical protein H0H93_001014 [Arthromyces matolae]|nr:hypothetical protein H0H93_001014 [Arthromyces matolae]
MSFNGTLDAWSAYLSDAQSYLPQSNSRLFLLVLVNVPVIAIILNVAWQLLVPRKATDPPLVFHWLPYVGSAIQYGNDPMNFFFACREKYGDVFTFVLLGRKMTVALGPKGNNFILGGKSTVLNAEDAYTHLTTPIFGKDVVYDVPNDKFMEQKRFVKVGLTSENFRTYVGMIEEEVEEYLAHDPLFSVFQANTVTEWGSFDVCKALQEITILTASRTLQGKEVRENLEALYQEQIKHFSTPDGKLRSMTYEELRTLPVMDAVIRETLRMHPPIHSIMRKVRDDVVIPPSLSAPSENTTYIIPQGHYVMASPAVSQTDPKVWKDALKWDPYRWSDPEGVAAQAFATYSDENGEKVDYGFGAVSKGTESPYQPFGAGKHRCIGEQFAYLQLGTIVCTIVRNMELRIENVPEHNYHTMITMPKTPRHISYRRRKLSA